MARSNGAPSHSPNSAPMPGISEEAGLSMGPRSVPPHPCSFCGRLFPTLQSLGGHQTGHRREIELMRQQHNEIMEAQRQRAAPPAATRRGSPDRRLCRQHRYVSCGFIPILLLTPNCAFWEAQRRTGRTPMVFNFMGIPSHGNAEEPPQVNGQEGDHRDQSSEETITDPLMAAQMQVEQGEEANSVNLDLSLKL